MNKISSNKEAKKHRSKTTKVPEKVAIVKNKQTSPDKLPSKSSLDRPQLATLITSKVSNTKRASIALSNNQNRGTLV